jgi:hypothetical protein
MAIGLSSESGRLLSIGSLPGEPFVPFWMRSGGTCLVAMSCCATGVEMENSGLTDWVAMVSIVQWLCCRRQGGALTIQGVVVDSDWDTELAMECEHADSSTAASPSDYG